MIRRATPDDQPAILSVSDASGLFRPQELEELTGVLAAGLRGEMGPDQVWVVAEAIDAAPTAPVPLAGVAYYAPERMADGVWNLYLIAVHPNLQGRGTGAALLRHAEQDLAARGVRLLLIETSSLPKFDGTRAFYRRCGYHEEARIRDYYRAGEDKVVFRKALAVG